MKHILFLSALFSVHALSQSSDRVHLYNSDRCNESDLVAAVHSSTNCSTLKGVRRTWGIKIGSECFDVPDSETETACLKYKEAGRNSVLLFRSDRCEGDLVAAVGQRTDCQSLNGLSRVWGIRLGGTCIDINDSDIVPACVRYKSAGDRRSVHFFRSDSCSGSEFIGGVNPFTDCSELANGPRVWGIKLDNKCIDISDMDGPAACLRYKHSLDRNAVKFYRSDRCDESEFIAGVSPRTNCDEMSGMPRVWGIRIGETCTDISDQDFVTACKSYAN